MPTENTAAKGKKDRSIRPALLVALIFILVTAILVAIPIRRQRQFVHFVSELSSMTVRAGNKGTVSCQYEDEVFFITPDAAKEVYNKIVSVESRKHVQRSEEIAGDGMIFTYGLLGGTLILAPSVYDGLGCVYVDFQSRDLNFTYLSPLLQYEDFEAIVQSGRQP